MATGGLHEDGLADVADAVRAHRSHERIMAILKDSRIGTYGALALIVSVVLRWQALAQSQSSPLWGLVAAVTLSRTALVVLAGVTPTIGEGLGAHFAAAISPKMVLIVSVQGVVAALLCSPKRGMFLIAATVLMILLTRWYFIRRLGGVNGDCLGACCQMAETMCLILLAWQPFI
jgi:adenosylcobinamide-GDP ribazoletransferase